MEEKLRQLLEDASKDENLRNKLLETRNSEDPMKCFCELFAYGQEMNDSKMRSVNGGGVCSIDGWDDAYDMFFASLEGMK